MTSKSKYVSFVSDPKTTLWIKTIRERYGIGNNADACRIALKSKAEEVHAE